MLQLQMKRPFNNPFFLPVAPFAAAPELLNVCYRPCSDVSMHNTGSDGGHFEHLL